MLCCDAPKIEHTKLPARQYVAHPRLYPAVCCLAVTPRDPKGHVLGWYFNITYCCRLQTAVQGCRHLCRTASPRRIRLDLTSPLTTPLLVSAVWSPHSDGQHSWQLHQLLCPWLGDQDSGAAGAKPHDVEDDQQSTHAVVSWGEGGRMPRASKGWWDRRGWRRPA